MKTIDLRTSLSFLEQYVMLRNSNCALLLTHAVTVDETTRWITSDDIEVRGLTDRGVLLGAVVLYVVRREVAVFVGQPNKGIGGKLLDMATEVALQRNIPSLWAWVLKKNTIARHVFEKKGFKQKEESGRLYKNEIMQGIVFEKIMNISGHTQENYDIRPEAKEFPLMCVLSFTYVCNSRCINCPYTNSSIRNDYRDAPFMSEETFKIIADQCGPSHAWIRISGGGEPMLHPQAVPLMEYAKKKGARVGLITNGSAFSEDDIQRLLEAGVDMIEFSVDASDAQTYERLRKGLRWDVLLGTISKCIDRRNKIKSSSKIIASVINQQGIDIERVASFWKKIVDNVQKRKYLTWGINNPAYSADPVPYLPPSERIPCPFLFERLNIDSRGKVMVCGFDIAARTDMGNVHRTRIADIWKGEGFEYYRQKHLERKGDEIELCRDCPDWQYRSWRHNYWKIVSHAEAQRVRRLDPSDTEGLITGNDSNLDQT